MIGSNWGDGDQPDPILPGRHARMVHADTRPWYRRVDWFSCIVIMVAIVMVCCAACYLILNPTVSP